MAWAALGRGQQPGVGSVNVQHFQGYTGSGYDPQLLLESQPAPGPLASNIRSAQVHGVAPGVQASWQHMPTGMQGQAALNHPARQGAAPAAMSTAKALTSKAKQAGKTGVQATADWSSRTWPKILAAAASCLGKTAVASADLWDHTSSTMQQAMHARQTKGTAAPAHTANAKSGQHNAHQYPYVAGQAYPPMGQVPPFGTYKPGVPFTDMNSNTYSSNIAPTSTAGTSSLSTSAPGPLTTGLQHTAAPAAPLPGHAAPAPAPAPSAPWSPPSDLVIKWSSLQVEEMLGQGGFGRVYKGRWQGIRVAIKMLERTGPSQLRSLQQEALIMSQLRHPCIARVFGLVDEPDAHAIVMQHYGKGSMSQLMRSPAYDLITLPNRLRMAWQVAVGMQYLHSREPIILHGDLKCSNLLLDDSAKVVIADFGLARAAASTAGADPEPLRDQEDKNHGVLCALTYSISPPEVLADPKQPRGPAVDVYAFGIVLYEMVTGGGAYKGMNHQQICQVVQAGQRPSIPEIVPPSVARIIKDCWAHQPSARPAFSVVADRLAAAVKEVEPASALDYTTEVDSSWHF